jgi:hypothetical protein
MSRGEGDRLRVNALHGSWRCQRTSRCSSFVWPRRAPPAVAHRVSPALERMNSRTESVGFRAAVVQGWTGRLRPHRSAHLVDNLG